MAGNEEEIDESLFPSAEDLKDAENIWGGGIEEGKKGRPVGSFQAEITGASLGRSASGDKLQIHYELKILNGPAAGEILHKYDGLGSEKQASITQSQLKRLGIDTAKVSVKTLPAHLLGLVGKKIVIQAKQNGDFHNIYFSKLLTDSPMSAARPSAGGARPAPAKGAPPKGGKPRM